MKPLSLVKSLLFTVLLAGISCLTAHAQCFTLPSYCIPTFTNVNSFSIGIQNVTIGSTLNNSSVATGLAPNYYDYTNLSASGAPGATLSISVTNGSGNNTQIRMYIDYNNDGTFATSSPEMVWTSPTSTASAVVTGSFTIPSTTPAGIYRMRFTGDLNGQTINPCALQYGEVEDYTLIVTGTTADAASMSHTSPTYFITGNNTVGFSFVNLSSSSISSINIGYKLDNNTPVTQSLSSLSIAPGAIYSTNFSTALNISSTGKYKLKVWVNNANGAGTQTPSNDTICRDITVYCGSALNGTYTINPSGSGSSNFTSIGAVDTALRACGVSGPVLFKVANGSYNHQLDLLTVSGASTTNTITFEGAGGNASSCILWAATDGVNPYVVRFNTGSHFRFRHMTIRSTGTANAWVVHFMNSTNNILNNCVVEMTGTGASSTSNAFIPIVINGNSTTLSTTSTINKDHLIDSCQINAGYYGIYCSNNSGTNTFTCRYSNFNNIYYYGVYFNSSVVVKFLNNSINMRTNNANSVAIYLINCNASGSNFHDISNNKMINTGQYGIQMLTSSGSGSAYGRIYNNMIGGGFRNTTACYGISDNSSRYQIYHNSINLDFNTTTAIALNLTGGSLHDIRNNNLVISASAAINAYPLLTTATSSISVLDYNNYYTNSGTALLSLAGVLYDRSNFAAAFSSGGGANSINLNPFYLSSTNLHTLNACNKGDNLLSSVSVDFDGQSRSNPPDIGADENSNVSNNDLGVFKINSPGFPLSTGTQSINVTLKNFGANSISSATVYYSVNGSSPVSQSWSGSLAPCDTVNFVFNTTHTFTSGSCNLKVYTESPNSSTDPVNANDTSQFTLCPAMQGVYTIGSSGNYPSFNAAVSDMKCAGIKGPVTFVVSPGTYNEQVLIPVIRGSSAQNQITFKSSTGIPSTVNLSFGSTLAANNYTLKIFANSYVKFKDMSISATGATYGTALLLEANTSYDSFTNVIFNGYNIASNTTNHAVIRVTSGSNSNYLYFYACQVNNGSYGTYIQGNSNLPSLENLTISACVFKNQYAYGMYHQFLSGLLLLNNSITTNSILTSYTGMYNYWIMIPTDANRPLVTGNRISGGVSGTGMYNTYFGVNSTITSARRSLVANNMIQIGSNASATYGLRESQGNGVDYMHNSVHIGNTQTTNATAAALFEGTTYGSNNILNNVFANSGGGAAIRINNTTYYPVCDYNNLYVTGTVFAWSNTTVRNSLAAWVSASARDANSISANPVFTSNTDLHSNQAAMDNAGFANTVVNVDIDNQPRCPNGGCPGSSSAPDIGADEYQTIALDGSISGINTVNACSGSSANVQVTLRNIGSNTLNSATIEWSVDGNMQTAYSWTGSLTQGSNSGLITIGSYAFTNPGTKIKVWATSPNGGTDGNNSNDTATSSPSIILNGTYTIGGTNPSFVDFNAAVNNLNSNGVCGPVTFLVRSGTYYERIQLNAIAGSSASNFITFKADPSNSSPVVLNIDNNSTANDNHTIFLNGTSFIAFEGLTISNNSPGNLSFGTVLRFAGTQDSVLFKNNIITGPVTTSTSTNFAVINHGTGTANMINRFTMIGNTVNNGSYGLFLQGNTITTAFESKNRIINNSFLNSYYTGILSYYQSEVQIIGNRILMSSSSSTGSRGIYTIGNDLFNFDKNTINNFGQYGLYLQNANYQSGTGTTKASVVNNMIGGTTTSTSAYGIYFGSSTPASRHINVYHNSVSVTSTATGAAFFFQNTNAYVSDIEIINNSFANYGTGTYICYYYFSGTYPVQGLVINYNNYYSAGTSNLQFVIGTTGYTVATGGSPTYNANSRFGNPNYMNHLTDLRSRPSSTQLNDVGLNLSSVTTDIENESRPKSPSTIVDIGADEYNYVPSIGVIAILQPTLPVSLGSQNVVLRIQNFSTTTVNSFTVKYKAGINGTIRSYAWTGILNAGNSVNHTFTGGDAYNYLGNYDTLIAWTENPNGIPDTYNEDDTAKLNICRGLNGVYTLDPALPASNSNFSSWEEVSKVLSNCGILANTVIEVASGVYSTQITFNSIPGASAGRRVVIQSASGNPADVLVKFNANISSNFTVRLNNTAYLTLKNISIQAENTSYGTALLISNANNNRLEGVVFNGIATGSTSNNLAVISSPIGIASFNLFDSCVVNNGSMGTYFVSNSVAPATENLHFNRCEFNNQYAYGMYNQFQVGLLLTNNKITTNSAYTNYYGMYNYWVLIPADKNRPLVTGNQISGGASGTGMYNYYFGVNSTITAERRTLVANNMVQIGNNGNSTYGIRDFNGNGVDYIHNSANIGSSNTSNSSAAGFFEGTSYGSNVILNNIFSNEGGGAAIRVNNQTYYPTCNYNNLFTTGSTLAYYNATAHASLASWNAATGYDANSMTFNPMFISSTDLHTTQLELDNSAWPNTVVTVDFDGQGRCPQGGVCAYGITRPDIGADEFDRDPPEVKAIFSAFKTALCDGEAFSFQNASTVSYGHLNYTWDFGDSSSPSPAPDPTHIFPRPGIYTVSLQVKSSFYGVTHDTSLQITVLENPVAKFKNINQCEGTALSFQNQSSINNGSLSYSWNFGDGASSTLPNPTHLYANHGTYLVRLTAENAGTGCKASFSKQVYQFETPVANFIVPPSGVCTNTEISVVNTSVLQTSRQGALWEFEPGAYSTIFNGRHTFTAPGVYNVKLKAVSEFNCIDSITKAITVKVTPQPDFETNQLCARTPTVFTNTSVDAFPNPVYTWTFSDNFTSNQRSVTKSWAAEGKYQVKLTSAYGNGCSAELLKEVNILPQPLAKFKVANICSGEDAAFVNQSIDSRGDASYFWDYNVGTSTIKNPVVKFSPQNSTTYTVLLIASYNNSCNDTATNTLTVTENPKCDFTYKNEGNMNYSFSPNNTGYTKYYWQFGNGEVSTAVKPQIKYINTLTYKVTLEAENDFGCKCYQSMEVNASTGLSELLSNTKIAVAPNPNRGSFTVSNEAGESMWVEVYDVLGKQVYSQTGASGSLQVDLDETAQGVYFVKVHVQGEILTVKIVVSE